eukprot:TRINITY_DN31815_c0_g1_i1.p1 TRINITY_DN31815_c0_g1~~TRINITY_DN31815_c0_g1_i1.p1  ORF type:complete len:897 (-),score=182.05 TRINITY_DN31815_c0_g1_i1:320-3010(-)
MSMPSLLNTSSAAASKSGSPNGSRPNRAGSPSGRNRRGLQGPPPPLTPLGKPSGLLSAAGTHWATADGLPSLSRVQSAPTLNENSRTPKLDFRPQSSLEKSRGSVMFERTGRARQIFDRKMLAEFEDHHKTELSKLELNGRDITHGAPIDQGLSFAARLQNFKKEQYNLQLQNVLNNGVGSPGTESGVPSARLDATATAQEEAEALAQVNREGFAKALAEINSEIEECGKSIRFEHLEKGAQDDKAQAAREEARRRKEAELRRARKKEQMARDPKRKVALRIENQRRFADIAGKKKHIPLQGYEVHGKAGPEKVQIVDILGIKNQCQFIDSPCSVPSMLEIIEREEKHRRIARANQKHLESKSAASTALPESSLSSDLLGNQVSGLTAGASWEEKQEKAADKRRSTFVQVTLQKVSAFRSDWHQELPFDMEKQGQEAFEKDLVEHTADKLKAKGLERKRGSVLDTLMKHVGKDGWQPQDDSEQKATERELRRKRTIEKEENTAAIRARTRKHWAAAKATTQWLMVLHTMRKRRRSSEAISSFLRKLQDWTELRGAMKNLIGSVKLIQRWVRYFLNLKRKRCAMLQKDWEKLEDHHLFHFAVKFAQHLLPGGGGSGGGDDNMNSSSKGKKRGKGKDDKKNQLELPLMQPVEEEKGVEWTQLRIPMAEKKAICTKYYGKQLRKHVRSSQGFVKVIEAVLADERELSKFLKTMGAERTTEDVRGFVHNPQVEAEGNVKLAYWQMSEELLTCLIAQSAQAMKGFEHFEEHPANKDVMVCKDGRSAEYVPGGDPGEFALQILKLSDRPLLYAGCFGKKERLTRSQLEGDVNHVTFDDDAVESYDIEDIFKQFTPRLKEIVEEQNLEYQINGADAEEALNYNEGPGTGVSIARGDESHHNHG